MKRIRMRHLIFLGTLAVSTLLAQSAMSQQQVKVENRKGPQPQSCEGKDITRIGFKDTVGFPEEGGRDYEMWKCADGWHFSNLAGEQAYIKPLPQGKFSTCVINSNTKEEFCCPAVSQGNKTKTKVKNENRGSEALAKKSSEWVCGTDKVNPDASDTSTRDTLYIIPLDKNGNRSEVRYKISGYTDATNPNIPQKDRKTNINIDAIYPNGTSKNMGSGSMAIEHSLSDGNGTDPQDCGADKQNGTFCQLPPNLLSHMYEMNKSTKGLLKDNRNSKQEDVKTVDPNALPTGDTFK